MVLPLRDEYLINRYESLKNEMLKNTRIENVSASSVLPGRITHHWIVEAEGRDSGKDRPVVWVMMEDLDFIPTIGMEILEGRDFSRQMARDKGEGILINESARSLFGWERPLGKKIKTENTEGRVIGVVTTAHDNTPDGTVVRTDQVISDYETIALAPDVAITNVLPGGGELVTDPGMTLSAGQPVCHFGVITGETCGTIERVNNGWFTMDNGVVSQRGDSGGPVYTRVADGRAVIIGLFNSTWGRLPAAVSWQATNQQLRDDNAAGGVISVAATAAN